jgi:exodeoxyribonuclease VII small subunit
MSELTYKAAIEELEQILNDLEREEIGVDELSTRLARAAKLMEFCKARLKSTEEEVARILKNLDESNDNSES